MRLSKETTDDESVERIVGLLAGETVDDDSDDLSLLHFCQVQLCQSVARIDIVLYRSI